MPFNSYEFIFIFLPVVLVIFFTLSKFSKNFSLYWLVIASLIFYGWRDLRHVPILIISMAVNYILGKKISREKLFLGLALNFSLLIYFKLAGNLPLGISFYTFTQTAYLIEIYRASINAPTLTKYFSFVSFFPHITSGPITNAKNFLPQINNPEIFSPNYENIARGLVLFFLGLFKKVCIADVIAPSVNSLFLNAGVITFFEAWTAALGYSMQLYFDFSGYSDMALGIALMFNIKLPENFNSPYKSTSIIDFWRRWHISLGAWVKDYIYIPLGGSREGEAKKIRNVIIAMLFTGIWHGTGWNFLLWGALHGVMLAVNHEWRRTKIKLPVIFSWAVTFLCVVCCWVIFRAENLSDAGKIIASMLDIRHAVLPTALAKYLGFLKSFGISFGGFTTGGKTIIFYIGALAVFFPNTQKVLAKFKPNAFWVSIVILLAIISFINFSGVSDFLYFQF